VVALFGESIEDEGAQPLIAGLAVEFRVPH
jgi:hypothetical protein